MFATFPANNFSLLFYCDILILIRPVHYSEVLSQAAACSDWTQRKQQTFFMELLWRSVDSPHEGPVMSWRHHETFDHHALYLHISVTAMQVVECMGDYYTTTVSTKNRQVPPPVDQRKIISVNDTMRTSLTLPQNLVQTRPRWILPTRGASNCMNVGFSEESWLVV